MKLIYWLASALAAMTLLALAACSEKPPGCADTEAISTARQLIVGEAQRRVSEKGIASLGDPDGTLSKWLEKSTVDITNIVDDGYDASRHLQSCKAHIKVMPPEGDGWEGDAGYTTQRVLDAPGKFQLELEGASQFASVLDNAANHYRDVNAYLGSFSGTYSCSGVGGAQDGPAGPFGQQVTMNVVGDPGSPHPTARLERVSRGGGVEKLAGAASNDFELVGQGANTPDDRWTTRFTVKISGNEATGEGDIRGSDLTIARRCTLALTKGSSAPTAAINQSGTSPETQASAPTQPDFAGEYKGGDDSDVTAVIGKAAPDGSFPVALDTWAVGGCGGTLEGSARRATDNTLTMSVARGSARCGVGLMMTPDGRLTTRESKGCSAFHGTACSFGDATLTRTK
jgi:hypothetical protein